uniref:Tyramine receptor n=1 Tax=Nilaparvata lugens TaxID=108931 RepID=A0A1Z2RSG6_NILLU|nr:tyramine receptor [Nilaparvata lugens]
MKIWLEWQQLCLITLFFIFIVVTVVGNTLIIVAVVTTRRLRTVTNCFVMSLAVADWLVGIFVMPVAVAYHIMGSWEMGRILCDVWISLDVGLCTASILSLCAISIDRYFAITQPLNYTRRRRSKRLALIMILVVWVAAVAITCPPIFGWYDWERHKNKTCIYSQNKSYVVVSAMLSFFVPLTVMIYVYARISWEIAQRHVNLDAMNNGAAHSAATHNNHHIRTYSKRCVANLEESDQERSESDDVVRAGRLMPPLTMPVVTPTGVISANSSGRSVESSRRLRFGDSATRVSSFKRESKTAQTLSIVVGGFIACWLPFFVAYIVNPFLDNGTIGNWLMTFLTWLGWLNSAINPFIYAFYSPDFRLAFWRLTLRHCTSRQQQRVARRKQTAGNSASRQNTHKRDATTHYLQCHRP